MGELAPALKDADKALLPDFGGMLVPYMTDASAIALCEAGFELSHEDAANVNFEVALAVLDQAIEEGAASGDVPKDKDQRRAWAKGRLWKPEYREYVYDPEGSA